MIALTSKSMRITLTVSVNTIIYSKKLFSIKLLQVWLDKNIVIMVCCIEIMNSRKTDVPTSDGRPEFLFVVPDRNGAPVRIGSLAASGPPFIPLSTKESLLRY